MAPRQDARPLLTSFANVFYMNIVRHHWNTLDHDRLWTPPPPLKLLLVNNLPISVFSSPLYLPREIRNRLIEEPDRALHRGWAQVHVALRRREIGVAR